MIANLASSADASKILPYRFLSRFLCFEWSGYGSEWTHCFKKSSIVWFLNLVQKAIDIQHGTIFTFFAHLCLLHFQCVCVCTNQAQQTSFFVLLYIWWLYQDSFWCYTNMQIYTSKIAHRKNLDAAIFRITLKDFCCRLVFEQLCTSALHQGRGKSNDMFIKWYVLQIWDWLNSRH